MSKSIEYSISLTRCKTGKHLDSYKLPFRTNHTIISDRQDSDLADRNREFLDKNCMHVDTEYTGRNNKKIQLNYVCPNTDEFLKKVASFKKNEIKIELQNELKKLDDSD